MTAQQDDSGGRDLSSRLVAGLRGLVGDDAPVVTPPALRASFLAIAAVMLGLWVASLLPAIRNWNNPNEDGFSFIPAFYASLTMLPVGLCLLAGGVVGRGKWAARARKALIIGLALLFILIAVWILQSIAAATGG